MLTGETAKRAPSFRIGDKRMVCVSKGGEWDTRGCTMSATEGPVRVYHSDSEMPMQCLKWNYQRDNVLILEFRKSWTIAVKLGAVDP